MRTLAIGLATAFAALVVVSPVSAVTPAPPRHQPGTPYTVLQMNLCLSGTADCYARAAYPAVLDEAAERIVDSEPEAVTLNEVCSRDAAGLARRAGYRMRFTAVLVHGAPLHCVEPGGRGVFGIAVLTKADIVSSDDQGFAIHTGAEQRRWICATTTGALTVCTAHLGTRGSTQARRANDAECAELQAVLAGRNRRGTTVFGGDLNRHTPCAPATMWAREDTAAAQLPGIQHAYGSLALGEASVRVATAAHSDHDFLLTTGRLTTNAG